jgi:hypothetical protein
MKGGDPYAQFGGKENFDKFIGEIMSKANINAPSQYVNHSDKTPPDPPPVGDFKCDMVIARYKEGLSWLDGYKKYTFNKIIVYNKGKNDGICKLNAHICEQHTLPNEGRCDHTYLYHIINNYDKLADVTIFTKGSSSAHREKKKLLFTISKVFETKNSVFSTANMHTPVHLSAAGFQLDGYQSSFIENRNSNPDSNKMKPACMRPFDTWYKHHFPDINVNYVVYAGIFAVSRKHIHNRPIEFYKKLLKQLEGHSNPEVGHYIERSWIAIFHPPSTASTEEVNKYLECMYHDIIHEVYQGGGTRRKKLKKRRRYTR